MKTFLSIVCATMLVVFLAIAFSNALIRETCISNGYMKRFTKGSHAYCVVLEDGYIVRMGVMERDSHGIAYIEPMWRDE